jgi:hypothetical protein
MLEPASEPSTPYPMAAIGKYSRKSTEKPGNIIATFAIQQKQNGAHQEEILREEDTRQNPLSTCKKEKGAKLIRSHLF